VLEMARPVRMTAPGIWRRWHQLGRWVRPVQDDTSLVGKLPKAAWQDCWALLARTTCKGTTKRRIDRASLATEHHVVPPGRIRPEEVV
jgi:hypothetical protein